MKDGRDYQIETPEGVTAALAERCRRLRLARKWKQSTLAERAGVSLASLRRFEQTGRVSLKSLLRLSFALGRLGDFDSLLQPPPADSIKALEGMTSRPQGKRGVR
jgi:transcriptional regulator with XRE-family HTH domain